jgi:hypothetical protein
MKWVFDVGNKAIDYFVTQPIWKTGTVELDLKKGN